MFVTPTDFDIPPYNLPNLADNNSFADYVEQIEKGYLRNLLGGTFYESMVSGIEALPKAWDKDKTYALNEEVIVNADKYKSLIIDNLNNPPSEDALIWEKLPDDKWLKLWKGNDYKVKGAIENWVGLKGLIIPLVFSKWLENVIDTTVTAAGVAQSKLENASIADSSVRYIRAFNDFCEIAGGLDTFAKNTLYNYLYQNSSLFDGDVIGIDTVSNFQNYLVYYFCNPGGDTNFLDL